MTTTEALDILSAFGRRMAPPKVVDGVVVHPGWVIDDENREAVTTCAAWFAREPRPGLDLNKGLLLAGNVGTGKTFLLRIIREAIVAGYGFPARFEIEPCSKVAAAFAKHGARALETWKYGSKVAFDDLGTEVAASHFGKPREVMEEVITARYDSGMWSHFTTNLTPEEIAAKYSTRVASRLWHMCNIVLLGAYADSTDRRATAPGRPGYGLSDVAAMPHPNVLALLRKVKRGEITMAEVMRDDGTRGPTLSDDLCILRLKMRRWHDAQAIQRFRNDFLAELGEVAAAPYVEVIDRALEPFNPQAA